jgi:plastocyanin
MRRAWAAVLGVVGALGALTAIAMAQAPPPTVGVTASPTSVAAQVTGPVAAGPTTFRITRAASNKGLNVYFALLNAGVSFEEFQAALRADDRSQGDLSLGLVSVQASTSLEGGQTTRDVTFTLKPGLTYVMLSEPETEGGPPPTRGLGTFTTGTAANGATLAAPDATIRMVKRRFRGADTLPRNGVVRFTNEDGVPHFAIAFPLRRGVGAARFGRVMREGTEREFRRIIAGAPVAAQGIISGGGTANDQQVRFTRAGRYGFVCFFDGHESQGMYRVIRVR